MKRLVLSLLIITTAFSLQAQEYSFLDEELKRIPLEAFQGEPIKLTAPAFLHDGTAIKAKQIREYMSRPEFKIGLFGVKLDKWQIKAIVFEKESPEMIEMKRKQLERRYEDDPLLNEMAPDFESTDLDGETLSLSNHQGKIVVLNFWFIACKPCIIEMPELNELVEEYKEREVVFLAIGLDRPQSIRDFLTKNDFDYRIVPDGRTIASDYGVYGYPTHLIIDHKGKVVFSQTGYSSVLKQSLKRKLKRLLR